MSNAVTSLFSPTGRVRRRTYWLMLLGLPIAGLALLLAVAALIRLVGGGTPSAPLADDSPIVIAGTLISLALIVAYLWIKICLVIKRWHDRDKPWPYIFIVFIPFVGVFWALIECGFMDGTQGPNQFGPSPKGIKPPKEVF